jgi:hypothetical protein
VNVVFLVLLVIALIAGFIGVLRSEGQDAAAWGVLALAVLGLLQRWG